MLHVFFLLRDVVLDDLIQLFLCFLFLTDPLLRPWTMKIVLWKTGTSGTSYANYCDNIVYLTLIGAVGLFIAEIVATVVVHHSGVSTYTGFVAVLLVSAAAGAILSLAIVRLEGFHKLYRRYSLLVECVPLLVFVAKCVVKVLIEVNESPRL